MSPDIVAVAEHRRGELREASFELVSAGSELAAATDGRLHVAVVGGEVDAFAERLDRDGVDVVHTIDEGAGFNHDVCVQAVAALAREVEPSVVLGLNSADGLDVAPALAARLDWPLVTDAIGLEYDESLTVTREMYASKLTTSIRTSTPAIVTLRPGEWPPADGAGSAEITPFEVTIDEAAVRSRVTGHEDAGGGDVDITDADVLVAIGRGIGEEDELELVFDLADALGATVAASRPVVDAGWLPKHRQVGQSGKTVAPEIYLALGISGAVQHVAGMKDAETIIAINTDPNAPIFDLADYGVVGDLFEVVPALVEAFS